MATDKLVDFDHVTDYISREAAISEIMSEPTDAHYPSWYAEKLKQIPAADVRPVDEISDAVYDAMYFLNSVSAKMPYHVYSALFDLISGICPNRGADLRKPNLDTTKGERRDNSSG